VARYHTTLAQHRSGRSLCIGETSSGRAAVSQASYPLVTGSTACLPVPAAGHSRSPLFAREPALPKNVVTVPVAYEQLRQKHVADLMARMPEYVQMNKVRDGLGKRALPVRSRLARLSDSQARAGFRADLYSNRVGAERGIRTPTPLRATVFEIAELPFAVVRRRSLEYENRPRVGSYVRHRTPEFVLTAVKLLSGPARAATVQSAGWEPPDWYRRGDSNPHGLPHSILSRARLPVPPLRLCRGPAGSLSLSYPGAGFGGRTQPSFPISWTSPAHRCHGTRDVLSCQVGVDCSPGRDS
jgi:hypothetical protein